MKENSCNNFIQCVACIIKNKKADANASAKFL